MLTPDHCMAEVNGGSKLAIRMSRWNNRIAVPSDNSRYEALCLCSLSGFVVLDDVLGQTPAQNFGSSFGDADTAHLTIPPLERQIAHQP